MRREEKSTSHSTAHHSLARPLARSAGLSFVSPSPLPISFAPVCLYITGCVNTHVWIYHASRIHILSGLTVIFVHDEVDSLNHAGHPPCGLFRSCLSAFLLSIFAMAISCLISPPLARLLTASPRVRNPRMYYNRRSSHASSLAHLPVGRPFTHSMHTHT